MTRKALLIIFGAGLAFALMVVTPSTRAQVWNQATQLTFNQPFEIPGNAVLPAGTYWFKVPNDPVFTTDFVQIWNEDQTRVLATLQTLPTTRSNAAGHTEVTFAEPRQKRPIALINWFYPGRVTGHEFVYSPGEEARLSESEQVTATVREGGPMHLG